MEIDTACSSSLTAAAAACDSLVAGNCEAAIVGGGSVQSTPYLIAGMHQGGKISGDSICRSFDEEANGMVPGEAVGVVILKPLEAAIMDGDHIHAVIKGWGMNQGRKDRQPSRPE